MYDRIDGPAWLETQADRLAGQSNDAEAQLARGLAEDWKSDRKTIDQLQDENTALQRTATELRQRLDNTLRAAQGEPGVPA